MNIPTAILSIALALLLMAQRNDLGQPLMYDYKGIGLVIVCLVTMCIWHLLCAVWTMFKVI